MTIALPGSSKFGLLGRKRTAEKSKTTVTKKPLKPHEVARLFTNETRAESTRNAKPAKLNDGEKQDRDRLSNLRGALYSKD